MNCTREEVISINCKKYDLANKQIGTDGRHLDSKFCDLIYLLAALILLTKHKLLLIYAYELKAYKLNECILPYKLIYQTTLYFDRNNLVYGRKRSHFGVQANKNVSLSFNFITTSNPCHLYCRFMAHGHKSKKAFRVVLAQKPKKKHAETTAYCGLQVRSSLVSHSSPLNACDV